MAQDPSSQNISSFADLSRSVLGVQAACRAALASVCTDHTSVRQLAKRLDLGSFVAWKLLTLMRSEDAGELIKAMPGGRGRLSIVEAIRSSRGHESADTVARAFEEFERTCDRLGLDQKGQAILAASNGLSETANAHSKQAAATVFQHYAELRGHLIEFELVGTLLLPSRESPDHVDMIGYQLSHRVTRLRPGAPIQVHTLVEFQDENRRERTDTRSYIVTAASTSEIEDEEVVATTLSGRTYVHVDPRPDRIKPITVAFLQRVPKMGRVVNDSGQRIIRKLWYEIESNPIRQIVVEKLFDPDLPPPTDVSAAAEFVLGVPNMPPALRPDWDPVPLDVDVDHPSTPALPDDTEILASARPFHRALIETVLEGTGRSFEEISGIRAMLDHPLPNMMITLSHRPPSVDDRNG